MKAVVNYTGVSEIHAGLGESVASAMRFKNSRIAMGSLTGGEYQRTVVLGHSVRSRERRSDMMRNVYCHYAGATNLWLLKEKAPSVPSFS